MHSLFALAAPLAFLLPVAGGSDAPAAAGAATAVLPAPSCAAPDAAGHGPLVNPLSALRARQSARQVRIEQRVMVRIAPQPPAARRSLMADLTQRQITRRYEERRSEKCLPLERIAGVQTGSGNRLVLFLRDRRMVSLRLDKSCRARDFYSGFYVERSKDGRLCVDRDKLQSRTGARCEVERMRELVEVED